MFPLFPIVDFAVLKHLEGDLELLYVGIKVTGNAVEERNTDFIEVMAKKPLDMNKLKMCQAQIAIVLKGKSKFQLEVGQVEKKIKKANEEVM